MKIQLKNEVLEVDNMANEKEFIINEDGDVVKNLDYDPDNKNDEEDIIPFIEPEPIVEKKKKEEPTEIQKKPTKLPHM